VEMPPLSSIQKRNFPLALPRANDVDVESFCSSFFVFVVFIYFLFFIYFFVFLIYFLFFYIFFVNNTVIFNNSIFLAVFLIIVYF